MAALSTRWKGEPFNQLGLCNALKCLLPQSRYYIWAARRVKDNGHRFSHTSMGTELVNCQGSHLRESLCRPIPTLSVFIYVEEWCNYAEQFSRVRRRGKHKGSSTFLDMFLLLIVILESVTHKNHVVVIDCWCNRSPRAASLSCRPALSLSHTHSHTLTPLCFPLMCCSNVNWGANWNGGISWQQWRRNKSFLWPLAHSGPDHFLPDGSPHLFHYNYKRFN